MESLSTKQQQIFAFLQSEVKAKGYPPSVREICKATNLRSTSTVHGYLEALERKGYIKRDPLKPRAIEILCKNKAAKGIAYVPVVRKITADAPILAAENIEDTWPLSVDYVQDGNIFMWRMQGDSMREAGILHNDFMLVRMQTVADNGDIVVALLDNAATVQRFYKESGLCRLQPENSALAAMIVQEVTILGKVTGLFRKM